MEGIVNDLEIIDRWLDEYERNIGLPDISNYTDTAQEYFNLTRNQLEKLSIEDCAHGAYILNNLALHIQRNINRENARSNWAKQRLKVYAADKVSQYRGSWEQQELQALKASSFGNKLLDLLTDITLRIDRLTFVSTNVRQLAESLTNIQRAKVGVRNG